MWPHLPILKFLFYFLDCTDPTNAADIGIQFVFASEEDDESDDSETNAPVVSRKRLPSTAPEKEHRSVSTVEAKNIDQRGNDTAELEKLVPSADSGRRLSSSSESRDVKLKVPIRHLDSIEPIATPGLTSQDPSETVSFFSSLS